MFSEARIIRFETHWTAVADLFFIIIVIQVIASSVEQLLTAEKFKVVYTILSLTQPEKY